MTLLCRYHLGESDQRQPCCVLGMCGEGRGMVFTTGKMAKSKYCASSLQLS